MSYQPLTIAQAADGYIAFFTGAGTIAGDNDLYFDRVNNTLSANMDFGGWGAPLFTVILTSGTTYNFESPGAVKIWVVGAGGGGGGVPGTDSTSAGGGAAGGVAYKTFVCTGDQTLSYSIGSGGAGGSGTSGGSSGGNTSATFLAVTLTANGGAGGSYNDGNTSAGGSYSGGDGGATGGTGGGSAGDEGGSGGGGIGTANKGAHSGGEGQDGAQSNDISGLQTIVTGLGYSWTTFGSGGTSGASPNAAHGGDATGVGCGGGGAGWYGGTGGNGYLGGGGGGASGYSITHSGGTGGAGFIVIQGTYA